MFVIAEASYNDLCTLTRQFTSSQRIASDLCDSLADAERAASRGMTWEQQSNLDQYVSTVRLSSPSSSSTVNYVSSSSYSYGYGYYKPVFTSAQAATLIALADTLR